MSKDGAAFDMNKHYVVAINSYRGTVVPVVDNNWKAIPELWVKNGAELDFPLFY